jgi:hypothetical protein
MKVRFHITYNQDTMHNGHGFEQLVRNVAAVPCIGSTIHVNDSLEWLVLSVRYILLDDTSDEKDIGAYVDVLARLQ